MSCKSYNKQNSDKLFTALLNTSLFEINFNFFITAKMIRHVFESEFFCRFPDPTRSIPDWVSLRELNSGLGFSGLGPIGFQELEDPNLGGF